MVALPIYFVIDFVRLRQTINKVRITKYIRVSVSIFYWLTCVRDGRIIFPDDIANITFPYCYCVAS